ncbi:hypothetical protein AQUCO_00200189v1 [Aquilegia coerulea]|uniref:Protein NUCLEAR FUSION DEFECTIVE 6, chloroplastic/mitochondrial-like n=1 Tax=Aquilegia coerulea TaxID=218851 RepID=A0A2G5F233_AQUCA|nr:hypothetical protein AQUCO_00200189v1 [Aquilegia coerulea]
MRPSSDLQKNSRNDKISRVYVTRKHCTTKSSSSFASNVAKFAGFASTKPKSIRLSRHKLSFLSRLPKELGAVQSLMPLHSATASALLTSMLSSKVGTWGWLSEEYATPL